MAGRYSEKSYGGGLYSASDTAAMTKISSWSFSIDGHQFVFLKLGTEGTFVYDVTVGEWYHWSQEGMTGLGFETGCTLDEFSLMAGFDDGVVYAFFPDYIDDYSGPFKTVASGGFVVKGRTTVPCYSIHAQGNLSLEEGREVSLYTSDDQGYSWELAGTLTPNERGYDLSWRSIGVIGQPGRIFSVVDNGAMKSIDGLSMGEDS